MRIAPGREERTASAIAMIARADSDSRIRFDDGHPRIAGLSQRRVERHRSEQRHAEIVGELAAATRPESVSAHVLHDAEELLARLLRHHRGAGGDLLRERLRRRHDEHLGAREQLAERDRHVACTGRHVDDDRVELAPVNVREELFERAVEHRPAPHHGSVVVEEVADRDQLQPAPDRRHDHLVDDDRALMDPQHVRDRVAVDVRIDHADLLPEPVERCCKVDRERRLADAALAARDRDHARSRIERDRLLGPAAAELRRQRGFLLGCHHTEAELNALDARNTADVLGDLLLEGVTERAAGDGERDRDRYGSSVDLQLANHVELRYRLAQLGVDHVLECAEDRVAIGGHTRSVAADAQSRRDQPTRRKTMRSRTGRTPMRVTTSEPRALSKSPVPPRTASS